MNPLIAKLKRFLEDRKYRLIDLKPGHVYFLWIKSKNGDVSSDLEPIVNNLKAQDIQLVIVISEEATIIECKD